MNEILVLAGPSGVGKSTLETYAKKQGYLPLVSATTRSPRVGEVNGKDYYFLDEKDFISKIKSNAFVEYAIFSNAYYGTLKSELEHKLSLGDVVCVLEPMGAHNIKKLYPDKTKVIVVDLEDKLLEIRMRERKDNIENIKKRLSLNAKMREDLADFSYKVYNNGSIEKTWEKIEKIIK